MNGLKIAFIGESMVELAGEPFGHIKQSFGGDTMNTAIYAKQLLEENDIVSYVTLVGSDPLSLALMKKWQDYQIDTRFCLSSSDKNIGLYFIHNHDDGEREFYYWRNDSAARYLMQHKDIDEVFDALRGYDLVYLSGISLAILPETDRASLCAHLLSLKRANVKIAFDSNYRPSLWQTQQLAKKWYEELYALCDIALVTYDDEHALWQDASIQDCITRLLFCGVAELVIKDGANGCYCVSHEGRQHVPAEKVAMVADTTAAGDSFNAGYLSACLKGQRKESCAALGNVVAAQVIQHQGAIVPIAIA